MSEALPSIKGSVTPSNNEEGTKSNVTGDSKLPSVRRAVGDRKTSLTKEQKLEREKKRQEEIRN